MNYEKEMEKLEERKLKLARKCVARACTFLTMSMILGVTLGVAAGSGRATLAGLAGFALSACAYWVAHYLTVIGTLKAIKRGNNQ